MPRRVGAIALGIVVAGLVGCSSSGSTSPPPSGTPVATTITIASGDNQSATASTTVANRPAVMVRDQNGLPMAGVSVTFAVDSGGGTVSGSPALTGSDGVAAAGSWTLGAAPGRNRLRASTGSLTPVVFTATAIVTGGAPLADATIPVAGGSVTVSKAGDPLNGTRLTLPSGAFTVPVEFSIAPATVPAPTLAGVTWISPVINITSSQGDYTAGAPFVLDIPAVLSPGYVPVAVLMNAATGAVETAPAVAPSSTMVRMITRHLSGSVLAGAVGSALRVNAVIQVVIGQVKYDELLKDISTTYNPLLDDWDFPVTTPLGGSDLNHSYHFFSAITAMSWFRSQSAHGALHLGSRFDDAPGVWQSDERAFKLAVAASAFGDHGEVEYNNALATLAQSVSIPVDSLQLLSIKSGMYVTGHPQLMAGRTAAQDDVATFVVYGSTSAGLKASFGMSNNVLIGTKVIGYSNGTFGPMTITAVNPETDAVVPWSVTVSKWLAFGESAGVQFAKVDALWDAVRNHTIGEKPPIRLESNGDSRVAADTVVVWSDTNRFWAVCDGCIDGYTASSLIHPTATLLGERLWTQTGGAWAAAGVTGEANGVHLTDTDGAIKVTPIGLMLFQAPGPGQNNPDYLDWRFYFIKYVKLSVTPDSSRVAGNQSFTLTATYSDPAPSNARWLWDMGDGRTLTTSTNTLTTTYSSPPTGITNIVRQVKVTLDSASKVWATATATVTVYPPQFAWQFTSVAQTGFQLPSGGIGSEKSDTAIRDGVKGLLDNLESTPGNSLFYLNTDDAGCRLLVLEQFPAGQFSPVYGPPGAINAVMGVSNCTYNYLAGTLTMGTLGSGTLTGSAVDVPQEDVIGLPGGSLSATMTGAHLSGTFTWRVRFSAGYAVYSFTFQATQVLPPP
jgi:hypothetical protein